MNAKQRRQVRRAEERIGAAETAAYYVEWAGGHEPRARVARHVMALVLRARNRRRWPTPKATAPHWHRDPAAFGHRCYACNRKAIASDNHTTLRWACREHGDWVPF